MRHIFNKRITISWPLTIRYMIAVHTNPFTLLSSMAGPSHLPCYLGDRGSNNTWVQGFINKSPNPKLWLLINANGGKSEGGTHSKSKGWCAVSHEWYGWGETERHMTTLLFYPVFYATFIDSICLHVKALHRFIMYNKDVASKWQNRVFRKISKIKLIE